MLEKYHSYKKKNVYMYVYIYTDSWSQTFTYTFQNLQNFNYFTKIRGFIQNVCYCLFSTDLN